MSVVLSGTKRTIFSSTGTGGSETTNTTCLQCWDNCKWAYSTSGGSSGSTNYYVAFQLTLFNTCLVGGYPYADCQITYDAFGTIGNRFRVANNTTTLFDSGCTTGSSSGTFRIPDATSQYTIVVEGACDISGVDLWSFTIVCL